MLNFWLCCFIACFLFISRLETAFLTVISTHDITSKNAVSNLDIIREQAIKQHNQKFNMCGYTAPKLDTVRVGFIGLGNRGPSHMMNIMLLEGVEIKALCDIVPEKVAKAKKRIDGSGFSPEIYSGEAEAWKKMCDRDDID